MKFNDAVRETIRQTEDTVREHSFAFNETETTDIVAGDCDDVPIPHIERQLGTVHSHTIEYNRISEIDLEQFQRSDDQLLCYLRPVESEHDGYQLRCYDKSLGVVKEEEF